jgi:hypothetical protein
VVALDESGRLAGAKCWRGECYPSWASPFAIRQNSKPALRISRRPSARKNWRGWLRSAGTASTSPVSAQALGKRCESNKGQEFVIAGHTVGGATFDALVFGYYEGSKLLYVSRTRNGFTPRLREDMLKRFRGLEITDCPFANLPEARGGRWRQGLTAAKMEECKWLNPVLVGQFEFTEWMPDNHLRHSRFIALREDKKPMEVRRE